jgi:2-keto-4-pentenoate hydratase/2-oxohepta-3-ene-1,7-dioic acid hydratase in catechol pathway
MNLPIPEVPSVFTKPANALADPGSAIPIPTIAQNEQLDYEVELAIVIGKDCKNVKSEEALNYVLGWTCANDLTARKEQKATSQWVFSKGESESSCAQVTGLTPGFDKFCPLGPCIVSTRALPDPQEVSLTTHVNGKIRQNGSASKMIWPIS